MDFSNIACHTNRSTPAGKDAKPMPPAVPPVVRIIRAPNPSPLTGSGTNTYILGQGDVAIIDPGPDLDAHLSAILAALGPAERVSHILVTHPHLDHSALAPRLSHATDAPVAAYGAATAGRSPRMAALALAGLPDAGEGLDRGFRPDMLLADGESISADTWALTALHTPGHLGAHLAFAAGDVLFSGDHVMGWSTSIIAPPDGDMTDYMASLARLQAQTWSRILPGHGDPIDAPAARLAELVAHRMEREAQILAALATAPATAATLASLIYTGLSERLLKAASANVLAHLIDLQVKERVTCNLPLTPHSIFHRS